MRKQINAAGILALLLLAHGQPATAVTLEFVPANQIVLLGNQAVVDVIVSDLDGIMIGAYDFSVLWDSSLVSLAGLEFDIFLDGPNIFDGGDSLQFFDDSTPGAVDVAEVSLGDLANQAGLDSFRLFELTFDTLALGTTPLDFLGDISPLFEFLGDANGRPVQTDPRSGSITIVATIPEPGTWLLALAGLVGMVAGRRLLPRTRSAD